MPRKLRIAFALAGLHSVARGAETAFEQIARELCSQGHEVTLFGSGFERPGEPYHFHHVPCIAREGFENWPKLPFLRTHYAWEELTFAFGLLRHFDGSQFDVSIACGYPYTNWVLRRGKAKHVFVTQNGDAMVNGTGELGFFDCDGLVCTNGEYFIAHGERFPSALIANGVDAEKFAPGPGNRAEYGLPENGPVALMVSALIPSKRVERGIQAAAKVPGLFLVVAGDGQCRDEVDAEGRRLMGDRYRRLKLPREKMPGLYRSVDLFLHMSMDEPSANAYLEALATGLPVVTHDSDVTRWTFEDTAWLVDTLESNLVSDAIAKAVEDRSPQAVERRRDLVRRRFTWKSLGQQYSDFLRRLCDDPGLAWTYPATTERLDDVGVVAIGRNEGQRLVRCLESVAGRAAAAVYVDSASDDDSVANAKRLGADVVELEKTVAFTAALARNMGVKRLKEIAPGLKYVQFVDGDCEVRPGWMAKARAELEADERLGTVCGRRRERYPKASIYNRLINMEWDTPIGPAKSVGGDSLFKLAAFDAVGGFDPSVMASEEPQLCLRVRHANWTIRRIDAEMTLHDAAITRFGQWWRRNVRAGYGTLDVNRRFEVEGERVNGKMVRSAMIWAVGWPISVIAAMLVAWALRWPWWGITAACVVFAAMPVQVFRVAAKALVRGASPKLALAFGWFTMLSKWAWFVGQVRYFRDRLRGGGLRLIEYKRQTSQATPAIPVNSGGQAR